MDYLMLSAVASSMISLLLGFALGKNAPSLMILTLWIACMFSISYTGTLARQLQNSFGVG
jgi:hypothetical protein